MDRRRVKDDPVAVEAAITAMQDQGYADAVTRRHRHRRGRAGARADPPDGEDPAVSAALATALPSVSPPHPGGYGPIPVQSDIQTRIEYASASSPPRGQYNSASIYAQVGPAPPRGGWSPTHGYTNPDSRHLSPRNSMALRDQYVMREDEEAANGAVW